MKNNSKVVCINDTFDEVHYKLIENFPKKGEFYTIRDILITRNGRGFHLKEILNPPLYDELHQGTFEPSFSSDRFREITEDELELILEEELIETI